MAVAALIGLSLLAATFLGATIHDRWTWREYLNDGKPWWWPL